MKGKIIIGIIATATLCFVLSQISSIQKTNNNRKFQEALEKFENSSNMKNDSVARQQMMDNVQKLQEKYEQSILPTKREIDSVNARLPILVSEGTLNTRIEYDERTKVQSFYFRFTQEVDESQINSIVIGKLKANMVHELKKSPNNVNRIQAGMTFLYVYYSVDNRRLYEIRIDSI